MRLLIITIILCFQGSVFATERLVLMTSLDSKTNKPPLRSESWNINKKLEKIFKSKLKDRTEELVIIHHSRAEELNRELSNPNNKAIFWVSHAGGSSEQSLFNSNSIIDYKGSDVSELFQYPSDKLSFLGLVGCKSKYLITNYKSKNYLSNNPNLIIYSKEKKQDARLGLKRAIKEFKKNSQNLNPREKACIKKEFIELTIQRTIPTDVKEEQSISSVKVLQRDRFIGLFPKGNPGDIQEIKVKLKDGPNKNDLKLIFDSGEPSTTQKGLVVLGSFIIENLDYQVFSNREGMPFGNTRHVYQFKGSNDYLNYKTESRELNCTKERE